MWQCDSRYVGRTSQRLQDRINYIPMPHAHARALKHAACSQTRIQPKRDSRFSTQAPTTQSLSYDSAIGLHPLRNPIYTNNYFVKQFSILAKGRSPFHLSVLEAIFIKTSNPIM